MTACKSLTSQFKNFDFIPRRMGNHGRCQHRAVRSDQSKRWVNAGELGNWRTGECGERS